MWCCRFVKQLFHVALLSVLLWAFIIEGFYGDPGLPPYLLVVLWFFICLINIFICFVETLTIFWCWGFLWPSLGHHRRSCEKLCRAVFFRALGIQRSLNSLLEAIPAAIWDNYSFCRGLLRTVPWGPDLRKFWALPGNLSATRIFESDSDSETKLIFSFFSDIRCWCVFKISERILTKILI